MFLFALFTALTISADADGTGGQASFLPLENVMKELLSISGDEPLAALDAVGDVVTDTIGVVGKYLEFPEVCAQSDESTTVEQLIGEWALVAITPIVTFFLTDEVMVQNPMVKFAEDRSVKFSFDELEPLTAAITDIKPGAMHIALPSEFNPFEGLIHIGDQIENLCVLGKAEGDLIVLGDNTSKFLWVIVRAESLGDYYEDQYGMQQFYESAGMEFVHIPRTELNALVSEFQDAQEATYDEMGRRLR